MKNKSWFRFLTLGEGLASGVFFINPINQNLGTLSLQKLLIRLIRPSAIIYNGKSGLSCNKTLHYIYINQEDCITFEQHRYFSQKGK